MKRELPIDAVIVDDEKLSRQRIRRLLEAHSEVQVVAECRNGYEAVKVVQEQKPDLLFLDIEMPEIDGFAVIEMLRDMRTMPHVVFITAFDKYAVRAFEVHAVDYLLKPVSSERLAEAVVHAHTAAGNREALTGLLRDLTGQRLKRFTVHASDRIYFVPFADVDWIEAAGNYVRLRAGGESHLVRSTMHAMEELLADSPFVRIHRSTIVNVDRIKELRPTFAGDYVVILRSQERLTLSRTYRAAFERITG